jgi:light-regulated signal transduction histidine kinase (bacteriophytochrome)
MRSLIVDLLAYSRVTTQARAFSEVTLAATMRSVMSDLASRLEASGGRVEVGALPTIMADGTQMRQLLQNLVGNGLKFGREGVPPVVSVRFEELSDSENACLLMVEDNGIGFEAQYSERIFAPFERLHSQSKYEGTGIGLAICRKIVERHGGSIAAQSVVGEGTRFLITLPLRPQAETTIT